VGVCTKRSITIFDFIVLLQLDLQLLQSGGNDKKKLSQRGRASAAHTKIRRAETALTLF